MSAVISGDGRYRYALWRDTDVLEGKRTVLFVMLNPSTADASTDDPTIRRCVGFARRWGFARLAVGNVYALRATDPRALLRAEDPVGPMNDAWLERLAKEADVAVAAWGTHAELGRAERVTALIARHRHVGCLGVTKGGQPRHPLYLPASAEVRLFSRRRR